MTGPAAEAPRPPAGPPDPARSGWQRWRKWIGLTILLVGLGYLVVGLLRAQPVSVEVQYSFGGARVGLREATMRYRKLTGSGTGEELRRITFRYGRADAPRSQAHAIMVQEGEYEVSIELRYDGRAPAGLGGRRSPAPGGGERLELSRPLIVSGAEAVTIFVDPRADGD